MSCLQELNSSWGRDFLLHWLLHLFCIFVSAYVLKPTWASRFSKLEAFKLSGEAFFFLIKTHGRGEYREAAAEATGLVKALRVLNKCLLVLLLILWLHCATIATEEGPIQVRVHFGQAEDVAPVIPEMCAFGASLAFTTVPPFQEIARQLHHNQSLYWQEAETAYALQFDAEHLQWEGDVPPGLEAVFVDRRCWYTYQRQRIHFKFQRISHDRPEPKTTPIGRLQTAAAAAAEAQAATPGPTMRRLFALSETGYLVHTPAQHSSALLPQQDRWLDILEFAFLGMASAGYALVLLVHFRRRAHA